MCNLQIFCFCLFQKHLPVTNKPPSNGQLQKIQEREKVSPVPVPVVPAKKTRTPQKPEPSKIKLV